MNDSAIDTIAHGQNLLRHSRTVCITSERCLRHSFRLQIEIERLIQRIYLQLLQQEFPYQTLFPRKCHSSIWNMEELSSSACALNLSGILNKTFDGTSELLKWVENEDHASPGPTEPNQTNQTFLEEKSKKFKVSLIILAKASHLWTFVSMLNLHLETCAYG